MTSKSAIKAVIALVVIGGGIGYFIYHAMQSSWAYYYSVDDFAQKSSEFDNISIRLAGIVKKGSIESNMGQMTHDFMLAGSDSEMAVTYKGTVPDNFQEDREVVVEGHLGASGVFVADKLMTRCESKYEAKIDQNENKQSQ